MAARGIRHGAPPPSSWKYRSKKTCRHGRFKGAWGKGNLPDSGQRHELTASRPPRRGAAQRGDRMTIPELTYRRLPRTVLTDNSASRSALPPALPAGRQRARPELLGQSVHGKPAEQAHTPPASATLCARLFPSATESHRTLTRVGSRSQGAGNQQGGQMAEDMARNVAVIAG